MALTGTRSGLFHPTCNWLFKEDVVWLVTTFRCDRLLLQFLAPPPSLLLHRLLLSHSNFLSQDALRAHFETAAFLVEGNHANIYILITYHTRIPISRWNVLVGGEYKMSHFSPVDSVGLHPGEPVLVNPQHQLKASSHTLDVLRALPNKTRGQNVLTQSLRPRSPRGKRIKMLRGQLVIHTEKKSTSSR